MFPVWGLVNPKTFHKYYTHCFYYCVCHYNNILFAIISFIYIIIYKYIYIYIIVLSTCINACVYIYTHTLYIYIDIYIYTAHPLPAQRRLRKESSNWSWTIRGCFLGELKLRRAAIWPWPPGKPSRPSSKTSIDQRLPMISRGLPSGNGESVLAKRSFNSLFDAEFPMQNYEPGIKEQPSVSSIFSLL